MKRFAHAVSRSRCLLALLGSLCIALPSIATLPKESSASVLVRGIALPNRASISNHFDSLERMDFTGLQNYWGHTLDGYAYAMDALGLRTNLTRNFGLNYNTVAIGYDPIGQITSWTANEPGSGTNGPLRLNEQLAWVYDAANNLHLRTNGSLAQTFTVDADNQLSSIAQAGTLTVSGATPAPATNITVNGATAQTNGDLTFASAGHPLTNGINTFTNAAWNIYGLLTNTTLSLNLLTNVTCQFDANGNLTSDGTRSFLYDAENQLTNVFVPGQWKAEFAYDGLGRRRLERDYTGQGTNWVRTNETRFICDGLLPIQERDSNNVVQVTYTPGLDFSGSLGGAGGIGGLLARTDATNGSTFYHADGAGSITALMDAEQNVVARYLYDPFGRLLAQRGTLAPVNRMQFSSMPHHAPSGLSLYTFRAYDPTLQRWLNHDPLGELGGLNMYGFVSNSPLNEADPNGLLSWSDFNPGLLLSGDAWHGVHLYINEAAHYVFYGPDYHPPNAGGDPNSQLAQANQAGVGITPLRDENGNVVQAGDLVQNTVISAGVQVGIMAAGGTEEEEMLLWGKEAENIFRGSKLARNCENAGKPVLKGIERAHHIVAESAKAAAPARDKLEKLGIDINDAVNGVGLPTEFHESLHTEGYFKLVNDAAETWKTKQDAINGLRDIENYLLLQSKRQ
jgi:RHS repeat-associated protein